MGVVISKRDGCEYYYYKVTGGKSIYMGTRDSPRHEAVQRAYKLFLRNKNRLDREAQIFQVLLGKADEDRC